jgi:hypothetical protein
MNKTTLSPPAALVATAGITLVLATAVVVALLVA